MRGSTENLPISDLQLISEAFDQPPSLPRVKIFVCSTPRTGSYFLCRAMMRNGIGVPHEYFHHLYARIIGPRLGISQLTVGDLLHSDGPVRRDYISSVVARRTLNSIFAAKIQWWQLARYLNNPEGLELLRGGHFIYLYREDLLAQAISLHVSMITGRWSSDGTISTPPAAERQFFDSRTINRRMKQIVAGDSGWRMFFAQNGIAPVTITYERMKDDIVGTLRRIVNQFALDVPISDLASHEARLEEFRDPEEPPKAVIRARFEEASRRVVAAPRSATRTARGNPAPADSGLATKKLE